MGGGFGQGEVLNVVAPGLLLLSDPTSSVSSSLSSCSSASLLSSSASSDLSSSSSLLLSTWIAEAKAIRDQKDACLPIAIQHDYQIILVYTC